MSSSTPHRSTITSSASLSAIAPHHQMPMTSSTFTPITSPSNVITSNQSFRRQTINSNSPIISQPNDEDLMPYINQTTESTRL